MTKFIAIVYLPLLCRGKSRVVGGRNDVVALARYTGSDGGEARLVMDELSWGCRMRNAKLWQIRGSLVIVVQTFEVDSLGVP